jgi:phosphoglycolate phosphatase
VPRVLLSDLDGTIADTAPAIFEALHITCAAMDIPLASDADLSFALGPPLHWCLAKLGVDDERMPDAIAVFETAHTELIDLVVPMPGAAVALEELARRGIAIGVATIKPEPIATLVLDTIDVRAYITALHARSDDIDPATKTDLVRAAAAELGSDAIYTGDHDNDEQAAKALGLPFLRYPDTPWDEILAAVLATAAAP